MVGILGFGNRNSPSADIRRSDASGSIGNPPFDTSPARPHVAASTVSDNNTSSGLHFFSLPHWTRRILPVSSSARRSLAGLPHADEHGMIPPSPSTRKLLIDKELPPPPLEPTTQPNHGITGDGIGGHHGETDVGNKETPHPLISTHYMPSTPPSQPTVHLDVYHNTPMLLPAPRKNSIAFASPPTRRAGNVVRASRSTHSLRSGEHHQESTRNLDGPRSRGVSLTQVSTTTKREANPPESNNGYSPSTTLVRKSSFWSRKPSPQHLAVPSGSPSLPVVQPASPFRVDFRSTSPDSPARQRSNRSAPRLSRRHSERASRRSSAAHGDVPALPHTPVTPNRSNKRPSTAGPYSLSPQFSSLPPPRRPTTADSATRFRSRSFFALSSHPVASPSDNVSRSGHPIHQSLNMSSSNTRPRSSTNPPLLHRLSVNLFASSPPSAGKNLGNGVASSPISRSPRPSLSQIPHDILKPQMDERPELFVNRLASIVSKADIAGILASSGDTFYADSLELFINRFGFRGDPLDVALRRLLMDVGLPRETQQIDRVIEAFANRYLSCNPDLFVSTDHTYILAFSLIMLHTDAFNKSNRRKMSKADYVKNTSLPGMIPEVLDCFYDNIVFAPFIFIEDPSDANGNVEGNLTRPSTSSGLPSPMVQSGNMLLNRSKIDPYYLITNSLLDRLRVNVEGQIPLENPFRWDGTGATWDYDEILLAFAKGHVVEIASAETRLPTAFFGLSVGGLPSPSPKGVGGMPDPPPAPSEIWSLKLTKVAVLNRKDDLLEGGKKPSNRKWRPFSVALTGSQLLLFRDLSWTSTLLSWSDPPKKSPIQWTLFRPDEIISLKHALAVFDRSYNKHLNTFSLTTLDGRHILLQTTDEKEMNEWISCINYASAFKTAGIRMRPLGMSGRDVELSGIAAATSHLRDLRLMNPDQPRILSWDHRNLPAFVDEPPGDGGSHEALSEVMTNGKQTLEMEAASAPEVDGASQFKETFDTVKAELAATRPSAGDLSSTPDDRTEKSSPAEVEPTSLTSRSQMVHTYVEDLEARICAANSQINSRMHLARHLGVLAPFQKSTRDRLQDAVQNLSKQIQAMRLDVTKLICHRNVLLNDLAAEERCFKRATTLALQAATETLQNRRSGDNSRSVLPVQEIHLNGSPQEHTTRPISHSFDSSVCNSFRSALDFGPDWPSSGEAFAASTFLGPSRITDSPTTEACDSSIGCYPFPDETSHLSLSIINQSLQDTSLHDIVHVGQDSSEEQAEEWNKTRAAKRVSLVKLPSSLRLSTIAGKSSRRPQGNGILSEDPSASESKPPRLPDFRTS